MKKKQYESPLTKSTEVELESGFMGGSVFDPDNEQDDGVTIEGQAVGNKGDYTEEGWDNWNTTY